MSPHSGTVRDDFRKEKNLLRTLSTWERSPGLTWVEAEKWLLSPPHACVTRVTPHTKEINVIKEIHPLWKRLWRHSCNTRNQGLSPCLELTGAPRMEGSEGKVANAGDIWKTCSGRLCRSMANTGVRDQLAVCYQFLCLSLNSVICTRYTWPEAIRQLAAVSSRSCMSCVLVEGSPTVWIDLCIPPWEGFIAWQMKAFFWASVVYNHQFLCKYISWRMSPKRNSLCCIGQISQQNGRIVIILLPSVASWWKQQIHGVWCQTALSVSTWLARGRCFVPAPLWHICLQLLSA